MENKIIHAKSIFFDFGKHNYNTYCGLDLKNHPDIIITDNWTKVNCECCVAAKEELINFINNKP